MMGSGFTTKEIHEQMHDMGFTKSRVSQLIKEVRDVLGMERDMAESRRDDEGSYARMVVHLNEGNQAVRGALKRRSGQLLEKLRAEKKMAKQAIPDGQDEALETPVIAAKKVSKKATKVSGDKKATKVSGEEGEQEDDVDTVQYEAVVAIEEVD